MRKNSLKQMPVMEPAAGHPQVAGQSRQPYFQQHPYHQ